MRFFSLLLPTITTQYIYIYIYIYNSIGICLSIDENHFVLSPHTHTQTHIYYNTTVSFHSIYCRPPD